MSCEETLNATYSTVVLNKNSLATVLNKSTSILSDVTTSKAVLDGAVVEIGNILTAVNSLNTTDFNELRNYILNILNVVQTNYAGINQVKLVAEGNNSKLDEILIKLNSGVNSDAIANDLIQIKTFLGLPL